MELTPLTEADFVRIMTEPENALTKQYQALVAAEGAELEFTADGIAEIARVAWLANDRMENIGARRLHTVMSTLMDEVLFELPNYPEKRIVFDRDRGAASAGEDHRRRRSAAVYPVGLLAIGFSPSAVRGNDGKTEGRKDNTSSRAKRGIYSSVTEPKDRQIAPLSGSLGRYAPSG